MTAKQSAWQLRLPRRPVCPELSRRAPRNDIQFCEKLFIFIFFLSFFTLFSCISLWRLNIAQIFYYDAGIFARPLWQIAHGLTPIIFHKSLGEIHFLGDHFSPSLYFLAPLFLFPNSLQLLLIEQCLALVGAGFLLYRIAKEKKLVWWAALSVPFIFFIFAGVINPLVTDWHTEPSAAFFLLLFIYEYFYKKKKVFGILSLLIFLGLKESNAVSLILALIPFYVSEKKQRRNILFIAGAAIIWFFLVIKLIIPSLIKQPYYYSPIFPSNPIEYITQFFNTEQKRQLLFGSFISFAFLPLFSLSYLLAIMGELGIRLLPTGSHFQSFTLGMHYNVFLGVLLALGTIQTLSLAEKKKILLATFIFLLLISIVAAKKITLSPIFLVTNNVFWKEWNRKIPLLDNLLCVPSKGSVMSQNNILPHLLQRKEGLYLLSKEYKKLRPDYIVMNLSSGQNINNFYSGEINELAQVEMLRKIIEGDASYIQDTLTCPDLLFFKKK